MATEVPTETTTKRTGTPRCFGIELETASCPNHHKLKGKTCFGAKEDGSIDGLEFYSPILSGDRGLSEVRKFCRLAKQYKFEVDEDCGYHLHIDMRGSAVVERKRIAYAYRLTFKLWQQLVRKDRWINSYCEEPSYNASELRDTHNYTSFECRRSRYEFLNLRAYADHTTYELRAHQGTLDATEICNWVKANLRFVEFCKDTPMAKLTELFGGTRAKAKRSLRRVLGPSLSNYYAKLWRKHAVAV